MQSEKELIIACLKGNRKAQKFLYDKYSPEMIKICSRYCGNRFMAEEAMQEGFLSVFKHLNQLQEPGKLRAWIKQIMVNSSLMKIRKKDPLVFCSTELLDDSQTNEIFADDAVEYKNEDLMKILDNMPSGYKIIFNLYAFEKYSHKQIAETLNISENTSKSQLSRARNYLRARLNDLTFTYSNGLGVIAGTLMSIISMR
jgi:RNA polymerase sigma-70 factor (ECF subfamily)